ncbi:MAG: hypothetical protein LBQ82_06710 [Treponema sp.]|jgi:hypothetical protein|nr:hypothetical protein [Treponema sp.]
MKKIVLFLFLAVFLVVACNEAIDINLPQTDTDQFISGNSVLFPGGTKAVDVYNTVSSIFNDNEWHDITDGEWKYIKTTDTDGLTTQAWETVPFFKIKHTSDESRGYIIYTVYLYSDDSNIKEITFNWHGEWVVVDVFSSMQPIEGDISFIFL